MFSKLIKWFKTPYPFPVELRLRIMISIGFGLFIFIFLMVFKPFSFQELNELSIPVAFVFGMITFSVTLINIIALPLLFKEFFNPGKWVIYKMVLFVLFTVFTISIINWYYSENYLPREVTHHNLVSFIVITTSVGFFPMLLYLYISEKVIFKNNTQIAEKISSLQTHHSKPKLSELLVLKGNNKNEVLELKISDLYYCTAEKNYVSVYYIQDKKLKEKLLRTTLNNIEKQMSDFSFVVRCHKSYIVNTNHVVKLGGNARNYTLVMKPVEREEILIPVSRSFPKELLFTLIS